MFLCVSEYASECVCVCVCVCVCMSVLHFQSLVGTFSEFVSHIPNFPTEGLMKGRNDGWMSGYMVGSLY